MGSSAASFTFCPLACAELSIFKSRACPVASSPTLAMADCLRKSRREARLLIVDSRIEVGLGCQSDDRHSNDPNAGIHGYDGPASIAGIALRRLRQTYGLKAGHE